MLKRVGCIQKASRVLSDYGFLFFFSWFTSRLLPLTTHADDWLGVGRMMTWGRCASGGHH